MRIISTVALAFFAAGCASAPVAPQDMSANGASHLTDEEKQKDPVPEVTRLLEQRETAGNLDHAIALLTWHVGQHPDSAPYHELLAEAHARSCEALDLKKSEDKAPHKVHRTEGLKHGEEAVKLDPQSGPAHYWYAANLLHAAEAESSLGRTNSALRQLDQADKLSPKIDAGGPARMRGRVLSQMPGIVGGSTKKAIANYQRSLELAPDCITTHLWLAEAYIDADKPDLARKELQWVASAKTRPEHQKEDNDDKQKARDLLKKLETK
jgi:tetratricopeptide (TPR) repeat protein